MSSENPDREQLRRSLPRLVRNPRRLAAPTALLIAFGLAFSSPLVGITLVAVLLVAGLYVGGRSEIAVVVVYILLLYFVSPRLVFGVYEVTPALLVGLGCILLWLSGRSASTGSGQLSSPMTSTVIAYFCIVLLTYGLGLTEPLLPEQFAGADRNLVKLMALVGVVLLIVDVVVTRRQMRQVFGLIVLGATFVGVSAILESFFAYDVVAQMRLPGFIDRGQKETGQVLRLGLQRATGTSRHPIELGTSLAIVLPIALHYVNYARTPRGRLVAMSASVIMVLAMVLSLSRSAYIGLAVGLVMLVPRWTSQRRFRFGVVLVPAVFSIAILAPAAFAAASDLVTNWRGEGIEGANVNARTEDYEVVRGLVLEHPWFGRGFGTFVGDQTFAADNQYLTTLIETGLIGTAALVVLMGIAYSLTRRTHRLARNDEERDLAASVGASVVVGVVSFGVFDAMAFDLTVGSLFLMFGMAGAMHLIAVRTAAESSSSLGFATPEVSAGVMLDGRERRA